MGKIKLYVNYWSGDFFVGTFDDRASAEKYFNDNKERYRDERGAKHGFPYATPIYQEVQECKKEGLLFFNYENERYGLLCDGDWINDGFSCGDCFEVLINGEWISTRIEMNFDNDWYLVGTFYCGKCLQNLAARI